MSSVTLAEARDMVRRYMDAERAVLNNQSYSIGTRTFTRADLSDIIQGRKEWQRQVDALSGGGSLRVRQVVPRDN